MDAIVEQIAPRGLLVRTHYVAIIYARDNDTLTEDQKTKRSGEKNFF